jgi:hypothetical protein
MLKLFKRLYTVAALVVAGSLGLWGVVSLVRLTKTPPPPDPTLVELAALRAHVDQRFDQLSYQCGPMIITTYGDDRPSTITGPDGKELEWGDPQ